MTQLRTDYAPANGAAPLSLAAMSPELRRQVLHDFADLGTRPSMSSVREALHFFDFLASRQLAVPHLPALLATERAILLVSEMAAPARPPTMLVPSRVRRHALASMVPFRAPPTRVLAKLATGEPLPPEGDVEHWLLIAPNVPNLARAASQLEAWIFDAAHEPLPRFSCDALESLWRAGALINADGAAQAQLVGTSSVGRRPDRAA